MQSSRSLEPRTLTLALYGLSVAYVSVWSLGETAYDDSHFFKRFAQNFLTHHQFSWNVADGPVHGSTSQLFQVLATLLTALAPNTFVTAVKGFNALCLLAAGWLLIRAREPTGAAPHTGDLIALLGLATPIVLTTLTSGMETALAIALLAASLLWLIEHLERAEAWSWRTSLLAASLTLLVYLCRPDAALVPAGVVLLASARQRRVSLRFLLCLGAGLSLLLAGFRAYYGTALPLSFYMKTSALSAYDAELRHLVFLQKLEQLGTFLAFSAPLTWIASAGARRDAVTLGLLGAALGFCAYHALATLEIMGYRARFYVPALVALILAAQRSFDTFLTKTKERQRLGFVLAWAALVLVACAAEWIPGDRGFFLRRVHPFAYAGSIAASALLLLGAPRPLQRERTLVMAALLATGIVGLWRPKRPTLLDDAETLRKQDSEVTTTRGIFDVARCLPAARNVYHSELGVTGLVLHGTRIVDLVGLLSKQTGLERRAFQDYCAEEQPEAIFLPHRNYRVLNEQIRAAQCFRNYRQIVVHSSSPLFVRSDLADAFLACATDVQAFR